MDGSAFWRALLRCNGHSSVEPFVYEHSAVSQPASCSAALLPEPPRHCVPVLAVLTPPSQNLPERLSSELYLALASTWHEQALGTQQHSFCPPPPICCFVLKHAPPGASCCRPRSLNLLPSPPFFGVYLHRLSADRTPVIPPPHTCGCRSFLLLCIALWSTTSACIPQHWRFELAQNSIASAGRLVTFTIGDAALSHHLQVVARTSWITTRPRGTRVLANP